MLITVIAPSRLQLEITIVAVIARCLLLVSLLTDNLRINIAGKVRKSQACILAKIKDCKISIYYKKLFY